MARRKNIALLMAILENDFSAAVLAGAAKGAEAVGANLIVLPMDLINATYSDMDVNAYRYQYNVLASCIDSNSLDGIVIEYGTIVSSLNEEEKRQFLSQCGDIPTVLLSEKADGYTSICVDNEAGLREIIEHLINVHGYRKIAYLSGTKDNHDAECRLSVYRKVMKENNLTMPEDWVMYGNFSVYVEDLVTDFVNAHKDVEAIVCANDSMAIGACSALRKMGIEPGKDIFVTGFDDIISGFLNIPSITTVKADPIELAYQAVLAVNEPDTMKDVRDIKTHIVIRESCGCCGEKIDISRKIELGISDDWREVARNQLAERDARRGLENELGNVTREMVFNHESENDRYAAILETLSRLAYKSCALFLYDEYIKHTKYEKWIMPESVNVVAIHNNKGEIKIFPRGLVKQKIKDIFDNPILSDGNRHESVFIPLFFGADQMGFLVAETEPRRFLSVSQMAGQISNTLYIIDINERQQKMQKELEEANKSKSQFLANMSHEIRTPINAIMGFNEMILRESKDENIDEYARDVKHAAGTLLSLVNDILDFSKIEAGKMDIILEEYALIDLLNDVIGMMKTRAEAKGLELCLEYDDKLPSVLLGDDGRLHQILLNLLSNAVKYTNEGRVTLKVSGVILNDEIEVTFDVKDTGIGIKEEDIGHLYQKFERIEEKRNRHIEGTGLGINITAGLLELMGTSLEVKSVYNEGSEFYFTVKQRIVDKKPICEAIKVKNSAKNTELYSADYEASDAKIMVVDDNPINLKVISNLLKETKINIDLADSGTKCIELVKNNNYDMILLDHMMPEMDGIETLNKLIELKLINKDNTKVIALTANAISGAKEMYLGSGFDDYLSKPVFPKDLNELLLRYLSEDKIKR